MSMMTREYRDVFVGSTNFIHVSLNVHCLIEESKISNSSCKIFHSLHYNVCLFLETNIPTAPNMAYETIHSPTATNTHAVYEVIPVASSSIPTTSNVAYAVPLQPDSSSLQPAAADSGAVYDTVAPQESSPVYDLVH